MTPRSDEKVRERTNRKSTMDRRKPTAGRENQQRKRTVHRQTSYHMGEILHSQQDLTIAVHHITRYVYTTSSTQCWITLTLDILNLLHLER